MQSTLRVPWVMFAARSLAVFGGFVPAAWATARGTFATTQVERAADELRGIAVLPGDEPPSLRDHLLGLGVSNNEIDEARRVVEVLNYGNAKYLLLITAWSEAIQGRDAGGHGESDPADWAVLECGVPDDMPTLRMVDPATVDARVAGVLARVARLHLHHGPASDFRALANWPDILAAVSDQVLAPVVRTPTYEATALALLERARTHIRALPAPAGITPAEARAVCTDVEVAAVTGVLFMFQRFILDVTIDMIRTAQAFDGPGAAARSVYSVR